MLARLIRCCHCRSSVASFTFALGFVSSAIRTKSIIFHLALKRFQQNKIKVFVSIRLISFGSLELHALKVEMRDETADTYGSGVWFGEFEWRTYWVLWKMRNANDAKKSRAVSKPAAGRNEKPVFLRKKSLISCNCGMRSSRKMPSFCNLAKTRRYSAQACFGIKSKTVLKTEPQVLFSTSV